MAQIGGCCATTGVQKCRRLRCMLRAAAWVGSEPEASDRVRSPAVTRRWQRGLGRPQACGRLTTEDYT